MKAKVLFVYYFVASPSIRCTTSQEHCTLKHINLTEAFITITGFYSIDKDTHLPTTSCRLNFTLASTISNKNTFNLAVL